MSDTCVGVYHMGDVWLSSLLGRRVRQDEDGGVLGRIVDVEVQVGDEGDLVASALQIDQLRGGPGGLHVVSPSSLYMDAYGAVVSGHKLTAYRTDPSRLRLRRSLLDQPVINIQRRRPEYVNDILLRGEAGRWVVVGANTHTSGILQRWGIHPHPDSGSRDVVAWCDIQPLVHTWRSLAFDKIGGLHPMDIALILNRLSYRDNCLILAGLPSTLAATTMAGVAPSMQTAVVGSLPPDKAVEILQEMAPDKAVNVLVLLSQDTARELLSRMREEDRATLSQLLEYPEHTAGSMMTTEYVAVPESASVQQTIDHLRSSSWLPDLIQYVYVVDGMNNGKLVGVVSLRDLFLSDGSSLLRDVMQHDVISCRVFDTPREVARTIGHYNLIALPLLDDDGRLMGVVTVDVAMDLILPVEWQSRIPKVFI